MRFMNRMVEKISGMPSLAAFCGAVLAWWMIAQAHGAINPDGLLYVEIARLFALDQWGDGLKLYPAPFYPLLILLVHKISGLGMQDSAHLLTVIAFALTSSGLVVLVRTIGGDRNAMLAAMALLFSSPYLVGDLLSMVMRDQVFWAAHLWSLVFFLRFYSDHAWRHAVAWGGLAMLSALFRIEAMTYLLLLPLVLLADGGYSWRQRVRLVTMAHSVLLGALLLVIVVAVVYPALRVAHLGRLSEPLDVALRIREQWARGMEIKAAIYAREVLGGYLKDYAFPGLLLTLVFALISKALSVAGWLQFAISLAGRLPGHMARFNKVLGWLVALCMINAVCILLAHFLLPKRYLMPLGFIILAYAAFGLRALFQEWHAGRARGGWRSWAFPAIAGILAIQLMVTTRPVSPEKYPELSAAQWINTHAPEGSRVYYDSRRIRYYATGDSSDRSRDDWPVVLGHFSGEVMHRFDYMVVRIPRKMPERQVLLTRLAGEEPVAEFHNGRGDKVLIYHVGG